MSFEQAAAKQRLITQLFDDTADKTEAYLIAAVHSVLSNDHDAPFHLDVFHAVLKRHRAQDQQDLDGLDPRMLDMLAKSPQLFTWIESSLDCEDEFRLVPFLMCMIDVTKAISGSAALIMECLTTQVEKICKLWYHPHMTVVRRSMELLKRLWPSFSHDNGACSLVLSELSDYVMFLQRNLTRDHLLRLRCENRTEFFYESLGVPGVTVDRECLKLVIQMILLSMANCDTYTAPSAFITSMFKCVQDSVIEGDEVLGILFDICANNDEDAVRLQRNVLDLYTRPLPKDLLLLMASIGISPHTLFLYFLNWTGFDHEILVDLLMSGETEFLEFFVKYLKYIHQDPAPFMAVLHDKEAMDIVDGILWRLVGILTAGEFPYNPSVLVHRIYNVLEHFDNGDKEV